MNDDSNDSQVLQCKDKHPTYKKLDQLRRLAAKLRITLTWNSQEQRFEVEDRARPNQRFWLKTDASECPYCGEHPAFPAVTEETVMTELSVHTRVDPTLYRDEDGEDW